MNYTPPQEILDRYADVLVNFALGGGTGIKAGDVVRVVGSESSKPLYLALHRAVWAAGAEGPHRRRKQFFRCIGESIAAGWHPLGAPMRPVDPVAARARLSAR